MSDLQLDIDELERNAFAMRRQFHVFHRACAPEQQLLGHSCLPSDAAGSESP